MATTHHPSASRFRARPKANTYSLKYAVFSFLRLSAAPVVTAPSRPKPLRTFSISEIPQLIQTKLRKKQVRPRTIYSKFHSIKAASPIGDYTVKFVRNF